MKGDLLECWKKQQELIGEKSLSHSAVILYVVLLDIWRSLCRRSYFTVSNKRLIERAGFGSHVSLDRAKKELVKAGLIEIDSSKKKFGTRYIIK